MKITKKLYIFSFILVIALLIILITAIYFINSLRQMKDFSKKSSDLKIDLLYFADSGKDLHLTANLDDSYKLWKESRDKFNISYDVYKRIYKKGKLSDRSGTDDLESFDFLWISSNNQMKIIDEGLSKLISIHKKDNLFIPGLIEGYKVYNDYEFLSVASRVEILSDAIKNKLMLSLNNLTDKIEIRVKREERNLIVILIAMIILIAVMLMVFFLLLTNSIKKKLIIIDGIIKSVKEKDLTVNIKTEGRDEFASIAVNINFFIAEFAVIISELKKITQDVLFMKNEVSAAYLQSGASINEMTANFDSITKSIITLVKQLEISNNSVRNITSSINLLLAKIEDHSNLIIKSASSIEEVNTLITNIAKTANDRKKTAEELVKTTESGGSYIKETNDLVIRITENIAEVNGIIKFINSIANETNLLSFNAAIESAHAGAEGMGFSVIAAEIRTLAESTNVNSKKIKQIIEGIMRDILLVREKSEKSSGAFAEVDKKVGLINNAVTEISGSMQEISVRSSEALSSMVNLNGIAANIKTEAESMNSDIDKILTGLKSVEAFSGEVKNGIEEINAGANEINITMTKLNTMQSKNEEVIVKMSDKVSQFKTGE